MIPRSDVIAALAGVKELVARLAERVEALEELVAGAQAAGEPREEPAFTSLGIPVRSTVRAAALCGDILAFADNTSLHICDISTGRVRDMDIGCRSLVYVTRDRVFFGLVAKDELLEMDVRELWGPKPTVVSHPVPRISAVCSAVSDGLIYRAADWRIVRVSFGDCACETLPFEADKLASVFGSARYVALAQTGTRVSGVTPGFQLEPLCESARQVAFGCERAGELLIYDITGAKVNEAGGDVGPFLDSGVAMASDGETVLMCSAGVWGRYR